MRKLAERFQRSTETIDHKVMKFFLAKGIYPSAIKSATEDTPEFIQWLPPYSGYFRMLSGRTITKAFAEISLAVNPESTRQFLSWRRTVCNLLMSGYQPSICIQRHHCSTAYCWTPGYTPLERRSVLTNHYTPTRKRRSATLSLTLSLLSLNLCMNGSVVNQKPHVRRLENSDHVVYWLFI